jgi:hypothetical protein
MSKNYKVNKNDTLASIARENGFKSIDTIINANLETWPYLSMHPNALIEGMMTAIPDKKVKKLQQHSGTDVTYIAKKQAKQYFNLQIEDIFNEIRSVEDDIKLMVNGSKIRIEDRTDKNIQPVVYKSFASKDPLPDEKINSASLQIKFTNPFTDKSEEIEIPLEIGGLDPIIDPAGFSGEASSNIALKKAVQKLLMNLGYYEGDIDGDLENTGTILALTRFQTKFMEMSTDDEDFGKASINTLISLGISHGVQLIPIQSIK